MPLTGCFVRGSIICCPFLRPELPSARPCRFGRANTFLRLTGLLKVRGLQVGPYKKADKEYRKDKKNSQMYRKYIKKTDYIKYYRIAVELAVVYLIALYEVYFVLEQGKDFTDRHKRRFLKIVSDADLSCPLKQKIFEKANAALRNKRNMETSFRIHSSELLTRTKFVTPNRIFKSVSDKDVLKA